MATSGVPHNNHHHNNKHNNTTTSSYNKAHRRDSSLQLISTFRPTRIQREGRCTRKCSSDSVSTANSRTTVHAVVALFVSLVCPLCLLQLSLSCLKKPLTTSCALQCTIRTRSITPRRRQTHCCTSRYSCSTPLTQPCKAEPRPSLFRASQRHASQPSRGPRARESPSR
jgi:hypothetical protein